MGDAGFIVVELDNGELLVFRGDEGLKRELRAEWRAAQSRVAKRPSEQPDVVENNDRSYWWAARTPDGRIAVLSGLENVRPGKEKQLLYDVYVFNPNERTPYFPWIKGWGGSTAETQMEENRRRMYGYTENYVQGGVMDRVDASNLRPGPQTDNLSYTR